MPNAPMFHTLVVGRTGYGKTTKVLEWCKLFKIHRKVLVLTPNADDAARWQGIAHGVTASAEQMDAWLASYTNCVAVIDEAGHYYEHSDDLLVAWASRGRHRGHVCFFIAQRAKMVGPNVRSNCSQLIVVNIPPGDCKLLLEDFADPAVADAHKLPFGEVLIFSYEHGARIEPLRF